MTFDLQHRGACTRPAIRVLFGCAGWPSGVLDVGSWAARRGLAEVVICQVQPGRAFSLDVEDGASLAAGPIDDDLADAFARHRRPLAEEAVLRPGEGRVWEVWDGGSTAAYRIVPAADAWDVYFGSTFQSPEAVQLLRWFGDDARDALAAVGGQFLKRLVDFDPHVVGFRLEGGDLEPVAGYVRAVRLVCRAEVVLGGPSATSHPREVLDDLGADYLFAGEAEETFARFLELAPRRDSKDLAAEIPGLTYRYGGRTWHNTLPADGYERTAADAPGSSCAVSVRCLRNLVRPVTGVDVLEANRLDYGLLAGFEHQQESLFFTGGRGCPGSCTFCAKLHGQEVRVKGARQLLEEIEAADARVRNGTLPIARFRLFEHTREATLQPLEVAWAAVYDEDFFLHRRRAIEFLERWSDSPLRTRYRLSFQTNPCTLLTSTGEVHAELLAWIDRLKPMIQVGAESFYQPVLTRWRKRHTAAQLQGVLDALDTTGQDYTVFILLTDFETTPEELVESLRRLIVAALGRRQMRIASSPFTIPLYDSETRRLLEYQKVLVPGRIGHFSDYERPQPGWMDPLVVALADAADAELRFALDPRLREAALVAAFEAVVETVERAAGTMDRQPQRLERLRDQARRAMAEIREARFQGIGRGPM